MPVKDWDNLAEDEDDSSETKIETTGLKGWYNDTLIGGTFTDHPVPQMGIVRVEDPGHPILAGTLWGAKSGTRTGGSRDEDISSAQSSWEWFDEWYNFSSNPRAQSGTHVLLTVDESSYTGGKHGQDHPIAWCRELEGGGRSFYTSLGHFDKAYEDQAFLEQLLAGILWTGKRL
jgi:hypothetical protein